MSIKALQLTRGPTAGLALLLRCDILAINPLP